MNMKPFPMFDDWVVLFGKDRATGEGAKDPVQMAMPDVFGGPDDVYMPHFGPEFDDSFFNETPSTSTLTPTRPNSSPPASTPPTSTPHRSLPTTTPRPTSTPANPAPKKGRKRTRMGEEEESFHANMNAFMKDTSSHMGAMVNSVGYERHLSERRQNVQNELGKLNITLTQKFKLSAVICEEEQRVDNFYGCKEEERQEYIEVILNVQCNVQVSQLSVYAVAAGVSIAMLSECVLQFSAVTMLFYSVGGQFSAYEVMFSTLTMQFSAVLSIYNPTSQVALDLKPVGQIFGSSLCVQQQVFGSKILRFEYSFTAHCYASATSATALCVCVSKLQF
ncbi:uncharacterized protein LOC131332650 [Rhododendron vialii]|uniref:uncharacterized protein LOC131332650 n=1 Tax=Rhododendron vialii TaxID=182163 RepID=UPI00265F9DE7|nr:uncharacterized protein LOC131332650 [Rhododendron vialii]